MEMLLEPVVIIDDDSQSIAVKQEPNDDIQRANVSSDPLNLNQIEDDILNKVTSEITIIPIDQKKTKPRFKIRLFGKKFSKDNTQKCKEVQNVTKESGTHARLISKEEAMYASDPYQKRKSSPLEKCPFCKKYFRRMKTHLLKHDVQTINSLPADSPVCTVCHKVFSTQAYLQIHMKSHTGYNMYVCEVCQKPFTQSCNLVNHMRIHTGEKPYKCPYCDRAFTQSGNLNNHIRLHTDEKPFKCHFCGKAFVQSGNLSSHIRNNHAFEEYSIQ